MSPPVKHPIVNGRAEINWRCLNNDVTPLIQNVDATDEAAIQAALIARAQAVHAHFNTDPTGEPRLFGNYDETLENDPPLGQAAVVPDVVPITPGPHGPKK